MSDGLFDNLKDLGFDDLSNIGLYKDKEKVNKAQNFINEIKSPENYIYEKKIECPVCYKAIAVKAIKSSGIRMISKDTDFMPYYHDPNPMLYDAWVCTHCGYAALSGKFNNIFEKQKKLVRENISSKWKGVRNYPYTYTIDNSLEIHQLALLNTVVKMGRDSEKAFTCLKLAWLYRLKKDTVREARFMSEAQKGFILALENENTPIAGLDEPSLEYLIGEICRRLGNTAEAIKWFGRVLGNPRAPSKIKDIARDQKNYIRVG